MFTGIIEAVGAFERRGTGDGGIAVSVGWPGLGERGVRTGDSVAVNGVCLTARSLRGDAFDADVSDATLAATTLGGLADGAPVNLERALTPATPLGGHLVTGHVDGVGEVLGVAPAGDSRTMRVRVPDGLVYYVARKGSICIDGVSLTVNAVDGAELEVNLVPHTLEHTTLDARQAGDRVNIEVDIIARYLERLLQGTRAE